MALYLPILTALLARHGPLSTTLGLALALGSLAVVLVVALRWGDHVSRLVFSSDDEVLLLRVLGVALLVAGLAQQAQVSAAVGAFLVGIALSGRAAEGARAVLSPLRDLFAAVFFVFSGLQTDPASIPPVARPALALGAATLLTKVATGWWAARRAGVATVGRFRAGTALVVRGEFSIVIAGLAVAAGIEPRLGPLATAYVLLMAVLGPVVARLAEPVTRGVLGRRLARRRRERGGSTPPVGPHADADSTPGYGRDAQGGDQLPLR